jgi:DNA modification methylase
VLIDESGGIIAGHGRVMAARKLGMAEVPCIPLAGLTETQRRAYVIADNRLAELAGWDSQMLALEMEDLRLEGYDLNLTGFDMGKIDEMFEQPEDGGDGGTEGDTEPQTDRADELRQKWDVKTGDLWQLGDHRLLCGDSTNAEDVAKVMRGEVEKNCLCFTSPPYNLGKNVQLSTRGKRSNAYEGYNDGASGSDWLYLLNAFLGIAKKHTTHQIINVQMLSGNKVSLCEFIGQHKTRIADVAVWTKRNPQPAMAEGVMNSAFEFVFIMTSSENPTRRLPGSFRGNLSNVYDGCVNAENASADTHSAAMPIGLPVYFISKLDAMVVYEPFCGTGTTIIACENLGRKCRAIEISPAYVAVALERWATHTGKTPIRHD